jgi:hypothetical protein
MQPSNLAVRSSLGIRVVALSLLMSATMNNVALFRPQGLCVGPSHKPSVENAQGEKRAKVCRTERTSEDETPDEQVECLPACYKVRRSHARRYVCAYFVQSAPSWPCKYHTHDARIEWYHLTPTVDSNMHTISNT